MLQRRAISAGAALVIMTVLTACNIGRAPEPTPDVNLMYTQAAQTLVAQFGEQQTQTAAAVTPTPITSTTPFASPSPLPTFAISGLLTPIGTLSLGLTPIPTTRPVSANSFPVGCNDAQYIGDTVKDKTEFDPGEEFAQAWSLLNVGTCTWDEGYTFAWKSGERMSGQNVRITYSEDFTKPGESQAFVVRMKAPKLAGEYIGNWQMRNDEGTWFGSLVYIDILVK